MIQQDFPSIARLSPQERNILHRTLRWKGLQYIHNNGYRDIQTSDGERRSLVDQYIACLDAQTRGDSLPSSIDPRVQEKIRSLPAAKSGVAFASMLTGNYKPDFFVQLGRYIDNHLTELKKLDQEKRETDAGSYTPSLAQSDEKPLEESEIETKILPFFWGYYRGEVYSFAPRHSCEGRNPGLNSEEGKKWLFFDQSTATTCDFIPDESDIGDKKIHTYTTVFHPWKPCIIPLPYWALPLIQTLESSQFQIMRDERGVYSLVLKKWKSIKKKIQISFEFVIISDLDSVFQGNNGVAIIARDIVGSIDEPLPVDTESTNWLLDDTTETFLQHLKNQSLSPGQMMQQVIAFVRKRFNYPEDASDMTSMNALYITSGEKLFSTMLTDGRANCHWSNIFAGELFKRLGIPHRIPTGYFVQRDPRFDFAALAGVGHAWSEVWTWSRWIRCDATPAKVQEKDQEQEDSEPSEGDYWDQVDEKIDEILSDEEIQSLYTALLESEKKSLTPPEPPKLPDGTLVSEWAPVEQYIRSVLRTPVSPDESITHSQSTLWAQLDQLFDLICRERRVPMATFRWPVTLSEGDELDDPVEAYIDIRSGESDPMGWRRDAQTTRVVREVTDFEDDMILDLTASMDTGSVLASQKKMVLSTLYTILGINDRLDCIYREGKLRNPLHIQSHVASFQWDHETTLYHTSDTRISPRLLCHIFTALDETRTGSGNLLGALTHYLKTINPATLTDITSWKRKKVLTICTDGAIDKSDEVVAVIAKLRKIGVIVQWIGFGDSAESLRVVCHDPHDSDAAIILSDVTRAPLARHRMLVKHLRP
jgi:Transglutaminase-like superfamily